MAEQQVRMHPAQASRRHSLFQLLCVAGDWSRALQQIQLCARMDANYTREAQVIGELLRCEIYRHACFQGEQRPGVILPPPAWMEDLLTALACNARGEAQEADTHRSRALEAITDTSGQWNGGAFDWISDSDSRTGPVLELIAGGAYLAAVFTNLFAEIAAACASDRFDLETRQRHPEQWRYTQCLAVSPLQRL